MPEEIKHVQPDQFPQTKEPEIIPTQIPENPPAPIEQPEIIPEEVPKQTSPETLQ